MFYNNYHCITVVPLCVCKWRNKDHTYLLTYLSGFVAPPSVHWARVLSIRLNMVFSVPFARTYTSQRGAFSVVDPSTWNDLPLTLLSLPRTLSQAFLCQLRMVLFG